jgi:predicted nuclease with RNAse H fold
MSSLGQAFVGIDVSADVAYVVRLGADGSVDDGGVIAPGDDVSTLVNGAAGVAIDAPDRPSTGPHAEDPDPTIPSKFRWARCSEVALLRAHYPVPWTTPRDADTAPPWMRHGFGLWWAFRAAGLEPIEVYPHATFHRLAGKLAAKSTLTGRLARADALRRVGVRGPALSLWGHDGLDAASAALVALLAHRGEAHPIVCAHDRGGGDGSAIWLPDRRGG